MPTFGFAMIIANLAFVHPETVAAVVGLNWLRGESIAETRPEQTPPRTGASRKTKTIAYDAADAIRGQARNQAI